MKHFTTTSTFTLAALLCAPLAAAQTPPPAQGRGQTDQTPTPSGRATEQARANQAGDLASALSVQRFDRLNGTKLKTPQGEEIGQLEDVIVGSDGSILYGVLSFDKIDGMTDKWYLMPWSNVQYRGGDGVGVARDGSLIIAVAKERLKNAPGFPKHSWPIRRADSSATRAEWPFGEVDKFYDPDTRALGRTIDASARTGSNSILRGSEIRGRAVELGNGDRLGSITDLVIDPIDGRTNYVVVLVDTPGAGDRMITVPWQALRAGKPNSAGTEALILPLTKDQMMSAPQFQRGDSSWSSMSDPAFIRQMYDFYSIRPYWTDRAKDRDRGGDVQPGADVRGQPNDRSKDAKRNDEPPKRI